MSVRFLTSIAVWACLSACGDFVRYAPDDGTQGPVSRGDLDDETLKRLRSVKQLDHLGLSSILARFVVGHPDGSRTQVDYDALLASNEAQLALLKYRALVDLIRPEQLDGRQERLAYWLNGVNAAMLAIAIDGRARDAGYRIDEDGFAALDAPDHLFGYESYSINQVVHGIIRADEAHPSIVATDSGIRARLLERHASLWGGERVDPRIHAGLYLTAESGPEIAFEPPHVFLGEKVDAQLEAAAERFVSHERAASGDGISMIFEWYRGDFDDVSEFIATHRAGGAAGVATDILLPFDWSLR